MRTVFVVNPKAGQGKGISKIINSIKEVAEKVRADVEVYVTKAVGDGERFVREYCRENGGARFIACGGDGTLGEVLNGAIENQDSEVGVMPMGTGNDFCRNFHATKDFMDIEAQIKGKSVKCDAIRYHTDNANAYRYCANMFNIGFDCNVADMTAKMKTKPFISGSLAYLISIFAILIKKKGANLDIQLDGEIKHRGKLLLTSLANGSYCGGGLKSNPLASVNDGFVNINIVKNISRLNFLTKLPFYMKGTHIRLKGIERVIYSTKCKKVVIEPKDGRMRLCADGEISDAGRTEFEIVHNAFNFVVPGDKDALCENRNEGKMFV